MKVRKEQRKISKLLPQKECLLGECQMLQCITYHESWQRDTKMKKSTKVQLMLTPSNFSEFAIMVCLMQTVIKNHEP